jgi:hypothetical protein
VVCPAVTSTFGAERIISLAFRSAFFGLGGNFTAGLAAGFAAVFEVVLVAVAASAGALIAENKNAGTNMKRPTVLTTLNNILVRRVIALLSLF